LIAWHLIRWVAKLLDLPAAVLAAMAIASIAGICILYNVRKLSSWYLNIIGEDYFEDEEEEE
jgi:hypothetical protein